MVMVVQIRVKNLRANGIVLNSMKSGDSAILIIDFDRFHGSRLDRIAFLILIVTHTNVRIAYTQQS